MFSSMRVKIKHLIKWSKPMLVQLGVFCQQGGWLLKTVKFVIFWIPVVGPMVIGLWWLWYERRRVK